VKRNTLIVGLVTIIAALATRGALWAGDPPKVAAPPIAPAPAATGQPPAPQLAAPAAKLAIVLSEIGTSRGAVDIAYPQDASAQQIQADVASFAANTGWQPGPIKWQKAPDSTTVHFAVSPGPHIVASQGLPIWPLLLTFRAYTNMEVVYLGIGNSEINEQFSNRFVQYSVRGSGGIASYNVTVKDPSFASVAEVSAPDKPGAVKAAETPAAPGALLWALLGLATVGLAGGAYWLSQRLIRSRKR
jgi:hypothetical protein